MVGKHLDKMKDRVEHIALEILEPSQFYPITTKKSYKSRKLQNFRNNFFLFINVDGVKKI